MVRRVVILLTLLAGSGMTAVAVSGPASATSFASSNITSPIDGKHYLITDAHPAANVVVHGTVSPPTVGATVDIRCYGPKGEWQSVPGPASGIPLDVTGTSFAVSMPTNIPYGTCRLRAVPHGWSAASPIASYTGPRLTTEWTTTDRIASGPNAGKVFDYYVEFVGAHAMNDFSSINRGGFWDSRVQYANGTSSNYLWYGNARLRAEPDNSRSPLQVDGRNAFASDAADNLFVGSENNPGFPKLTFSATRQAGIATIHETVGIVRCPADTFPATAVTCPRFRSTGIRLERTIVITDGGLQVRVSDVWRSTDHKPHAVSADYEQSVEGYDRSTGSTVEVQVGVKQPWLSNAYAAFISDTVYPGPAHGPASIFVRDNTLASDGDRDFARGAISFDLPPKVVHRTENRVFFTRPAAIKVPAGGSRLVRQFYVVGTSQATVNAKAAANEERINPYRPDALIRKGAGGFVGNRVYNDDGAHQTSSLIRSRGSSATFLIKVQNHGTTTDGLTVAGPGAAGGFGVKYLAGATGTRDITTAVVNGTYRLTKLAPGAQRLLRLVVTVQGNAGIAATHSWRVRATSTTDGARRDAVQAKVSVVAR